MSDFDPTTLFNDGPPVKKKVNEYDPTSLFKDEAKKVGNMNVDFNVGTIQADLEAKEKFDAQIMSTLNGISGLNKQEKEYLLKTGKSGQLSIDEFKAAANAMRGEDVRQKQVVDENGKLVEIVNPMELAKQQGEFSVDNLNQGVQNLFGVTGQALGQGHYYMKPNKNGVMVPVPLAVGERPEAGYTVDSIWGTQDNANDDNRGSDITKKLLNLIPSTLQGILSLPELAQGLVTGKKDAGFRTAQQELESYKFKTSEEFNKNIVDVSKVKEFSDVFSSEIYDLSPSAMLNTGVNVGTSILQLFLTRGALGFSGKVGQAGSAALTAEELAASAAQTKMGTALANFTISTAEGLKAAEEAGVNGRAGTATALVYALVSTGLESKFGIESKILNKGANDAKKKMIKQIIKDNVDVVDGKLTKESVEKLYKETIKKGSAFYKEATKNAIQEGTTEVLQDMSKNASEEIHDYLMRNDPDEAKYNTKFWSPKALAGYVNSFGSGLIGGVGGSPFTKNAQSETAYTAVAEGKESELKADLSSSLKRGKITQDEYERAVFKVDSYKEYYDATKDRPINDVDKRKIFDLTYEKQNIKSSIESLEKNNPNGINDVFIAQKEAELKDITNQANEIWAKASAATNSVKQTTPVWKTTIDKFAKTTNNKDKALSKDFTTREQIETAVGITPELNQLAKPFKVEFKTPSLPEEAGGIKIENGFLSEPYMTEKTETSEPTLKTRELPVYAMEDKEGGTWLFAVGEKTDNNIPDTSYLIKVDKDGKYDGHEEFNYEAPKKNTLTFDNIPDVFNELGLEPVGTAKAVNEFKSADEQLFAEVYDDVVAGNDRGKMTALNNGTLGVIVNGKTIKFASSYHTNANINRENIPDGDVEIGIRAIENVETPKGAMKGLMVYNLETGNDIGYLRATDKSSGVKSSGVESDMTDIAKQKLAAIEADQKNYIVKDGKITNKEGKEYKRVSSYINSTFSGKEKTKTKAFGIGKVIEGIVKDFFEGNVKDYSEYNKNMDKAKYDTIISQLNSVKKYAKQRGFSIITKQLVIADDANNIAGIPNLLMVDKDGNFFVYDISTVRKFKEVPIKEQMQRANGGDMSTEVRVSKQVNIYADILEKKYGVNVGRGDKKENNSGVGVIPFFVSYNATTNDLKVTGVEQTKRIDYERVPSDLTIEPTSEAAPIENVKEEVVEPKPKFKKISDRQRKINNILTIVAEYNALKNGRLGKDKKEGIALRNKIDNLVRDMNDPNVQFAIRNNFIRILNAKGNKQKFVGVEINNRGEAKDYVPLKERSKELIDLFNKINDAGLHVFPKVKGMDGKLMSKSQLSAAVNDVLNDIPTNAANELLNQMQGFVDSGSIEIDKGVSISLEDFINSISPNEEAEAEFEQDVITEEMAKEQELASQESDTSITEEELAYRKEQEANEVASAMKSQNIIPPAKDIIRGEENDEMAFQKKAAFRSEKAIKVKEYLQKVLGNKVDFMPYTGKEEIAGYVQKDKNGKAQVFINDNYAGLDTPIHEVGHILIESIGYNNRVIQAAIKQLKDTDLWKETAKAYPELSEEGLGKEVLAEAIGREGAGIFEEQVAKSKFKQFLDYIFDKAKQLFGVDRNIAKSLAKQVLAGNVKVDKNLEVAKQEQKTKDEPKIRRLDEDTFYRIAFGEKIGLPKAVLKKTIATYQAMVDNDPTDKAAARNLESSQKRLEEFEKAYVKYGFDYNKLNTIKSEQGELDDKSFDELIDLYNTISEFDPNADNAYLASVKYRIAYLMAEEQRAFLESKGNNLKPREFADIKDKDVYMKALGHMTEAFPEMQYLSKAYDAAVQAMNEERREKQNKITELAKAVAKEESKTLGLKMKDFVSGKAYEFFKWMDKGGELISTEDAYKLSKAKGDYVKYYREIRESYKDVQEETPAGFDENSLLMTDKGFAEKRISNGIVGAIQSWLGTSSGMKQVVMNYTHSDKRSELLTLEEIELALQKEAEKGPRQKVMSSIKSAYYNTKAKKLLNKGTDEEGNDITHLKSQADYIVDRKGKLVNKFGVKRKEGYDYSKDFHAAIVQYLNDITWTKHMQPIIPLVDSVEQFANSTGASKGSAKNLAAWIGDWKKMHIYKDKPMTRFPELEMFLKFLRKMTSLTSLAFNVKASIMNISIAEYNNWKELGGKAMAIGHGRLVANTKLGKKKISTKAHNILMKYGVVATDYDETSTLKAVGGFNQLAMGMTKFAEYIAQGSMFLGQMTKEEWAAFDQEGNYTGSDPKIKEKLEQYKTKVSNTHGKYSAKDRRNFELYELGKFVGQFKTWVPDWWKERFGSEYIDQYGKRQKGTYTDFLSYAIKDLRKDIMKPEFWTSDKLEYVNARKNLKAAMVFGILLAIRGGNDEDKKKRQKADFLSQAIGNLTFIFDPEQAKYVLKTPFAGMSYANNMLNLMTDLSVKNTKKVVPYAKVIDVQDMFGD